MAFCHTHNIQACIRLRLNWQKQQRSFCKILHSCPYIEIRQLKIPSRNTTPASQSSSFNYQITCTTLIRTPSKIRKFIGLGRALGASRTQCAPHATDGACTTVCTNFRSKLVNITINGKILLIITNRYDYNNKKFRREATTNKRSTTTLRTPIYGYTPSTKWPTLGRRTVSTWNTQKVQCI